MKIEIDNEVDAAYVQILDRPVARTQELDSQRNVDLDANGEIIGIEFLAIHRGVDVSNLPRSREIARLFQGHNIPLYA